MKINLCSEITGYLNRTRISALFRIALGGIFFGLVLPLTYVSCSSRRTGEASNPSRASIGEYIERTKGINIGESRDIWAVTFMSLGGTEDRTSFNIYKLALNVEKGLPVRTWKLKTPSYMNSGSGSRTYVSEWGLLVARSATAGRPDIAEHPDNEVTLYLVPTDSTNELVKNQPSGIRAIFTTGPAVANDYAPLFRDESPDLKGTKESHWGRASTLSYKVTANGKEYKYIGVIWRLNKTTPTVRLERFLWDATQRTFIRVRPYEFTPQEINVNLAGVGVYNGALSPCDPHLRINDTCVPAFYSAPFGKILGVKLNGDIPSTKYDANTKGPVFDANPIRYLPPNVNSRFQSTSHPAEGGGAFGSINGGVYSAAVDTSSDENDPGAGSLFITSQNSAHVDGGETHVAFDRINDLVFSTFRASTLNQPPKERSSVGRTIVSVFRKECFYKTDDCSPDIDGSSNPKKDKFRIFGDVGAALGPISDLGNGCVASLDLNRPVEGLKQYSGVYRICVKDPNNLAKGVGSLKIADFEGNAYMYNDFTAATLYDRPVILNYDFLEENKLKEVKNVRIYWEPKQAYPSEIFGLNLSYRCYKKGTSVTDSTPLFIPIPSNEIPKAYADSAPLANCGGADVNQVDLKLEVIGRQKYMRFQKIRLSSEL
ncbi:MAG: hypothetical protein IPK68_13345 [Bdellovibrionales bacterium]|nr:hypothetical protein [Bdellovibrionales bacterium]